jgi:hypothetical protein
MVDRQNQPAVRRRALPSQRVTRHAGRDKQRRVTRRLRHGEALDVVTGAVV